MPTASAWRDKSAVGCGCVDDVRHTCAVDRKLAPRGVQTKGKVGRVHVHDGTQVRAPSQSCVLRPNVSIASIRCTLVNPHTLVCALIPQQEGQDGCVTWSCCQQLVHRGKGLRAVSRPTAGTSALRKSLGRSATTAGLAIRLQSPSRRRPQSAPRLRSFGYRSTPVHTGLSLGSDQRPPFAADHTSWASSPISAGHRR